MNVVERDKMIELGRYRELTRIIKLLEPRAKHDEEMSVEGCYPEDCNASTFQYVIDLIKGETK